MNKELRLRLKKEAQALKPGLTVGKNLINESVVEELRGQLKKHGLVKVKVTQSAKYEMGVDAIATELSGKCGAVLVERKGGTVVLYKR